MRALVIEDYQPVRRSVVQGLTEAGFAVDAVDNGEDGLWMGRTNPYDAIVLDLMLPKLDGLTVLQRLRATDVDAGILILTAKDAVADRVAGLNAGADDYLIKPFAFEELLARLMVLVRRRYDRHQSIITVGNLKIDTATQTVSRDDEAIALTKREYSLLTYLALRAGETVSRSEIWDNVYEFNSAAHSNVVDVYIRYLRQKLERPGWPPLIHTRRGFGYRLADECQS